MPEKIPPVDGKDLDNLRESGLTDETIWANRLRTEGAALVFPYRDLRGNANCFARRRPHVPRVIYGKVAKYEQPKGMAVRAYFPKESLVKLRDGRTPVCITEGEKKALALSQLGLAAVGIGGFWCGCNKDELIEDLARIPWKGRDAYIVFDYDQKPDTRRQAAMAARRLARALHRAGAKVINMIDLPPGKNGAKQGVDDFLVAHGAKAFQKLVEQARPVPVASSDDTQPITVPEGRTDAANSARLVAKYRDVIRWVGPWDKWLIWDGQRWKIDQALRIEEFAKQVAAELWKQLAAEIEHGGVSESNMKAMYSFAKNSNNVKGVTAMVALARSEADVRIGLEELDTDPWLLNVENGTVDLRTGKLRDHRQEDFITKLAPVTVDPAATCPLWIKFLDTTFSAKGDLIGYMRRLVGYCLAGVTEEHILPFLYGIGANGKSTFCETIMKLMGLDYAMKAAPDLLLAKRGESHPTDRADLLGKRFVACVETAEGRRLAESLVKEMTGGDNMRARRMREDFWQFTPTHHVWIAGNHKPKIVGTDHGIWRRIKLIPFDVVIPEAEQDKKLKEKLAGELSGILNWAIQGGPDWQRGGMQEPEIVQMKTQEYAVEEDDVGQFVAEQCEKGDFITSAADLYRAFQKETPGSQMSMNAFGARLGRLGFENHDATGKEYRTKKGMRARKGLRLRTDAVRVMLEKQIAVINNKGQKRTK